MSVEAELRGLKIRHLVPVPAMYVASGTSVGQVIQVMRRERAACVLIGEPDRVAGIFTERDLLTKIIGASVDDAQPIDLFMTPAPKMLGLDDSIADAISVLHEGGYRHVPLRDAQGRVTGIMDVRHIIEFLAEHFPDEVLNLPPRLHQRMGAPEGA